MVCLRDEPLEAIPCGRADLEPVDDVQAEVDEPHPELEAPVGLVGEIPLRSQGMHERVDAATCVAETGADLADREPGGLGRQQLEDVERPRSRLDERAVGGLGGAASSTIPRGHGRPAAFMYVNGHQKSDERKVRSGRCQAEWVRVRPPTVETPPPGLSDGRWDAAGAVEVLAPAAVSRSAAIRQPRGVRSKRWW